MSQQLPIFFILFLIDRLRCDFTITSWNKNNLVEHLAKQPFLDFRYIFRDSYLVLSSEYWIRNNTMALVAVQKWVSSGTGTFEQKYFFIRVIGTRTGIVKSSVVELYHFEPDPAHSVLRSWAILRRIWLFLRLLPGSISISNSSLIIIFLVFPLLRYGISC